MFYRFLRSCFTCVKTIPVIFITLLVGWSYFAFLFRFCTDCVKNFDQIIWILLPYHLIFFLFTWSYYKTFITSAPKPPNEFYISSEKVELLKDCSDAGEIRRILTRACQNLPIACRTFTGAVRYCRKCKCLKPDRSHHCSVCNQCVLKMDHHCPWVNNCVHFFNYKYFVLFLWYGEMYCLFIALLTYSSLTDFLNFLFNKQTPGLSMHVVMLWIFASLFAFGLLILSILHTYLILKNLTTIEMLQAQTFVSGPVKNGFHLGFGNNFIQIFGRSKRFWFLPVFTSFGDGITFPINPLHAPQVNETLKSLNQKWMEEGSLIV